MRQAIHIFKKDVHHQWLDIRVELSVVAAFAFTGAHRMDTSRNAAWTLVLFLLPLTWWALIARLIHDEALPGDNQFWITRPYSWRSLLGAKALFILAFINLPMLVADAVIVHAYGLRLAAELGGLFWSQILLTVFFLFPMAALSALTDGFVQLIFAILTPCVVALLLAIVAPELVLGSYWGPSQWVRTYYAFLVILIGTAAILFWQYARLGTLVGRSFAIGVGILVLVGILLIPWSVAFSLESRLSKQQVNSSVARVGFDSGDKESTRALIERDGRVRVVLPLRIVGLPPSTGALPEGFSLQLEAPDGKMCRVEQLPLLNADQTGKEFPLQATVDGAFYRQVKDEPLRVRGSLYLTLFGNPQTSRVPFENKTVSVPRIGACLATEGANHRTGFMICSSAFRFPPLSVFYRFMESLDGTQMQVWSSTDPRPISYSPFPAEAGIDPVSQDIVTSSLTSSPLSEATVYTVEPLAHIRRDFEIDNLKLGDFEAPSTTVSR